MIANILALAHKGMPESEFRGLGRINVVCGKNNSGKSTVLEALNKRSECFVGSALSPAQLERIQNIAQHDWLSKGLQYRQIIQSIVDQTFQRRKVWFKNQGSEIGTRLAELHHSNSILRTWAWSPVAVVREFEQLLPTYPTTVLIPPLRQPELVAPINTSLDVQPGGGALVNYLHYAKNQYGGSDREVYERIHDEFRRVTSGFDFVIQPDRQNNLHLSFGRDGAVPREAEACGRGLQDILVMLYFSIHPKNTLILIEEPESHVHPDMQRRLLAFMREQESKQFFVTTHSNVFLDAAFVDRVFFTTYSDKVTIDDATGRARILSDLGYSITDNLVSDLVILVEGPTDAPIVEEFLVKLGLWERFAVKIWPMGGDIMDQLDLSVLGERYRMIALLDQDPGSSRVRQKFIANCERNGIRVVRLERRAIENYFTIEALRTVFKGQIPAELTSLAPDRSVVEQLGLDPKRNNRAIARAMDIDDIGGTDLMDFFEHVKTVLETPQAP